MPRFSPIVEIAPGATVTGNPNGYSWTDLTMQGYVHEPSGISIRRGRQDRFSEASPDTCALALLNTGGVFVPKNPLSPFYGRIATGTPLRILMRPNTNSASDAFNRTTASSWGSADAGGPWTNFGTASDYSVGSGAGRHTNNAATTSHFSTLAFSLSRVDIKVRVRVNALSTGGGQQAGITLRHVDSNNQKRAELLFAVGGVITLRIVSRSAGVDTTLASATLSVTHSTSAWYWIRIQTGSTSSRAKAWLDGTTEPAGWNIDSTSAPLTPVTSGAAGTFSRRDTGNTNAAATTDFDTFVLADGPRTQFTGFVDQWPIRFNDPGMAAALAPITASGQLQRLTRAKALKSAIYREATTLASVVGYWPMEDGSKAQSLASALPGGVPGGFEGMALASDSDVNGSDPLPVFSTAISRIWFPVPTYTSSGVWSVAWVMKIPATSLSGSAQVMSWITPGQSIGRWAVTLVPGTPDVVRLDAYSSTGVLTSGGTVAFTDVTSGAELSNGRQVYFIATGTQNGGNVDTSLTVFYAADADGVDTATGRSDSFAGTTGRISYVYHDANTGFSGAGHTIGHVLLGTTTSTFVPAPTSVNGGAGDTTGARFAALLATQSITSYVGDLVRGQTITTQQMGPQRTGDILSQLREVELTEVGVMHDGKQGFVELLPRSYRYNRPIDLTLDVPSGQVGWPFEPSDDDYLLRNDVTVSNAGGSSAYARDDASIASQGVYADSATVNVYRDGDLQQHAEWRKNLGTSGTGLRYPSIVVNLTRTAAALTEAWLNTDIGSRIQVTNVPSGVLPPEDLDLVVDGYVETITSSTWTAVLNCSPGAQWLTAVLDSSTPRLDCGASTTAAALTSSATNMLVAWADSCNWTHVSGDYDVVFGGETATVGGVDNAVRDTFTRSASSGWGTSDSGHVWSVGAGTLSLFSATGSVGQIAVSALNTEHHIALDLGTAAYQRVRVYQTLGVTPTGAGINWGAVLRRTDAANLFWIDVQVGTDSSLTLRIISKIAGANTQLASAVSATTHSTTVARILVADIDASNTVRAKVYSSTAPEPTWELVYDASAVTALSTGTGVGAIARLMTGNTNAGPVNFAFDNFAVLNPQALTVTRSTNGVVKPHAAGEEVHVANPIILAL